MFGLLTTISDFALTLFESDSLFCGGQALGTTCAVSAESRQAARDGGFHSAWVHVLMVGLNYMLLCSVRFLGHLCYGPKRDVEWGTAPQPSMVRPSTILRWQTLMFLALESLI
eukprot:COSAG05_NODE_1466_length_4804_cov_1.788523_4_plen_113_part_00